MGFNGAALLKARKGVQFPQSVLDVLELQRGRAFESAEGANDGTFSTTVVKLQRGRAFESAEGATRRDSHFERCDASTGPRF
ncbi:MAG: hypothetical protein JWL59_4400 [Chthoniobacteraceae bacterium]|nr:hypothetical protein [Chthoniobacteraceae bacterium]